MSTARSTRARSLPAEREEKKTFTKRAVIASSIAAAAALAVLALLQVVQVLLMTFAGVLCAVFLWRVSQELAERTPLEPGASLALVVFLLAALVGGLGFLIGPGMVGQFEHLMEAVPRTAQSLEETIREFPWGERLLSLVRSRGPDLAGDAAARVTSGISRAVTAIAYAFVVVFVGIYLAYSPSVHWNGLMHLLPPEERPRAKEILLDIRDNLWCWVLGRLFSMALVGAWVAIGLWALGVPSAGALGLVAGLLDFVPNFGPFLAFLPAMLMAVPEGGNLVLYVALLYLGVQAVESVLLTPLVENRVVAVPPALVIVSQVLAGVLFGVLGLLLATPLTVTIMVLVRRLYVEDYLGDSVEEGRVRA